MSRGFADFFFHHIPDIPGLRPTCKKARLSRGQIFPFWDSLNRRYIYKLLTKDKFSDKPDLPALLSTFEAMKSNASMHEISTIAIPKVACGLDKVEWQDVVKLLRDVFAYSDIHIVLQTLESHGVHALSSEGDPEFYAEDEIDRYSEKFHLNEKDLKTDFTRYSKSCRPTSNEQFPFLREKEGNDRLIQFYQQYPPKELVEFFKEFDFQYSDISHVQMTLLFDMLIDSRNVYTQHKLDVGKTRQDFHVTLKPNVELKKQRPSKVPLHLEKLEKSLPQLKDADIIREMGDDDEMGSLFVNPRILMPKNDYVKLVIDARYLNSVTDLTDYWSRSKW